MSFSVDFRPDPERAASINRQLAGTLMTSLLSLLNQFDSQSRLSYNPIEYCAAIASADRINPAVYAVFNRMLCMIRSGMIEDAHRLASTLISVPPSISGERMVSPYRKGLTPYVWDIYDHYIDCDEKLRLVLNAPNEVHVIEGSKQFARVNEILPEADLALFQELCHLVVQIVVFDDRGSSDMGAESASSFALWGSVLVNMRRSVHELYFLEALLHESAHLLLFGLCQEHPVVTNSWDERFASPLRSDLRTMDGLFHAAYVTARIHYGLTKLKDCKAVDAALTGLIDERCAIRQGQFRGAVDVIRRYGKLTGHGRDIINSALDCMGEPSIVDLAEA